MNSKGQIGGIEVIMTVFISVIAGLVLYGAVVQIVGESTTTYEVVNHSVTATAGAVVNLPGEATIGTVTVLNSTSFGTIDPNLYVVASNQVVNGLLTATITINTTGVDLNDAGWDVSYTAEPEGYVGGTGRSMALLIPIFAALALAIAALSPTFRNGVLDLIGK